MRENKSGCFLNTVYKHCVHKRTKPDNFSVILMTFFWNRRTYSRVHSVQNC